MKYFLTILAFITSLNLYAQELTGTVISDNEKIISSKFMGYIKEVNVSEGDFVKKGEILYIIDSSNIDSLKNEALSSYEIQRNNLENIKLNYERYKRLYKKDLVAKYDLELLELKLKNTEKMLKIAQAKVKEINTQYEYLKIKAPNDGLIIKKSIKEGELAMPSSPAFILTDLNSLKIKTSISESQLSKVKINDEVIVIIDSINYKTKGKIKSIIPNTVNMTHSFILKIEFDKKDKNIYPGMYSKVILGQNNE
ncbi:efflux transporter periplasmic adaptor subunit [Halarcobacter mediterraneus]|uniref:Efflux transporter periplasmic adaptor subunit n=1 Tax=Halarcobacter mediterraneus TaxID=2023153 RepID=A0A4Q1AWN6_9BACT|nr:efflux RND transporter periplasmic adaptor subunit [Halarcobacter mediterraneus]RXK14138.1 efflux transporter periplasmic adaptor subunit [Halarcobacter mediterraneus]